MASSNVLKAAFPRPLSDDPEFSYTLPSRYYTDPAVYELEKEKIFSRSWMFHCHVSQVAEPGAYVAGDVVGQPVFVVRDRKGELRAFHNVCQHRAHELVQGAGTLKATVTCPYHAWAYGLDGELRTARNCEHVKGFDKADFALRPVRVEVLAGLVFVNLDDDAMPLVEQAPNLEADIRSKVPYWDALELMDVYDFGGRPIDAGWKVVVDNYVECYHCAGAHPAFADLIELGAYQHTVDGITACQVGPETRPTNSAYTFDKDAVMTRSVFWYLWPTTTINVLPGNGDLMVTQVIPDGPARTAFRNHRFAPRGVGDDPKRRNYLENILGKEDMVLCESVQRGLHSRGYDQGRIMVDHDRSGEGEHVIHFFHKMVHDALEA